MNTRLTLSAWAIALTSHLPAAWAAPYTAVALDKSQVRFQYKQMGVSVDGHFRKFNPQISFDPAKPELTKAVIELELGSVDAGSSDADQELSGKAWFNTAAFPKASFALKQLKPTGPNQYEATGSLTLKGQTRELKFPLTHNAQGKQGTLGGSVTLRRGDFAIGDGPWSKFDIVANEVVVSFQIVLTSK